MHVSAGWAFVRLRFARACKGATSSLFGLGVCASRLIPLIVGAACTSGGPADTRVPHSHGPFVASVSPPAFCYCNPTFADT